MTVVDFEKRKVEWILKEFKNAGRIRVAEKDIVNYDSIMALTKHWNEKTNYEFQNEINDLFHAILNSRKITKLSDLINKMIAEYDQLIESLKIFKITFNQEIPFHENNKNELILLFEHLDRITEEKSFTDLDYRLIDISIKYSDILVHEIKHASNILGDFIVQWVDVESNHKNNEVIMKIMKDVRKKREYLINCVKILHKIYREHRAT